MDKASFLSDILSEHHVNGGLSPPWCVHVLVPISLFLRQIARNTRAGMQNKAELERNTVRPKGVFNEHTFYTGGPERQQPVALSAQAARVEEEIDSKREGCAIRISKHRARWV